MAGDARIKHFIEEEAKPAIRNTLPKLVKAIKFFEDLAGLNGSVARNNAEDVAKVRVEEIEGQEKAAFDAEKEAKRIADKEAADKAEEEARAERLKPLKPEKKVKGKK